MHVITIAVRESTLKAATQFGGGGNNAAYREYRSTAQWPFPSGGKQETRTV